jgi:hypothetical protein
VDAVLPLCLQGHLRRDRHLGVRMSETGSNHSSRRHRQELHATILDHGALHRIYRIDHRLRSRITMSRRPHHIGRVRVAGGVESIEVGGEGAAVEVASDVLRRVHWTATAGVLLGWGGILWRG